MEKVQSHILVMYRIYKRKRNNLLNAYAVLRPTQMPSCYVLPFMSSTFQVATLFESGLKLERMDMLLKGAENSL